MILLLYIGYQNFIEIYQVKCTYNHFVLKHLCLDNKVRGHARVRSTDIDYVSTCLDKKVSGHALVRSTDIDYVSTCLDKKVSGHAHTF